MGSFVFENASRVTRRLFDDERIVSPSAAPQKMVVRCFWPCFLHFTVYASPNFAGLGHRPFDATRYPAPQISLSTNGDLLSRWAGSRIYKETGGFRPCHRSFRSSDQMVLNVFSTQRRFICFSLRGSGSAVNTPFDLGIIIL